MESYNPEHTKQWSCCNGTKMKQEGCHHASTKTSFEDIDVASQDRRKKVSMASAQSIDSSIGEELHSSSPCHSVIDTDTHAHTHTHLTRPDSEPEVIQTNDSPKQNVCGMSTSTLEVHQHSNGLEDSGIITDEIDDNKGTIKPIRY